MTGSGSSRSVTLGKNKNWVISGYPYCSRAQIKNSVYSAFAYADRWRAVETEEGNY